MTSTRDAGADETKEIGMVTPHRARMNTRTTYRVTVTKKRDGSTIKGIMEDDGLQSLWAVTQDDGTTAYVTELDTFVEKIELTPAMLTAVRAIKAGQRPAGLSDTEWEYVRTHPYEAVTK